MEGLQLVKVKLRLTPGTLGPECPVGQAGLTAKGDSDRNQLWISPERRRLVASRGSGSLVTCAFLGSGTLPKREVSGLRLVAT